MVAITTEAALRALYAAPAERALRKELDHLDRHCRRFIAYSPFVVLATADADGRQDLILIVHDRVLVYRQDAGEKKNEGEKDK